MFVEIPNLLPFANNPKLLVFTVYAFSDFENVSVTLAFNPTPVAPFPGVTITTAGAVVSVPAAVPNQLPK
jgi:hypothetical protein